jgi:hypothetical protein
MVTSMSAVLKYVLVHLWLLAATVHRPGGSRLKQSLHASAMAYGNVMMDAQRDYRSCWNVMSHGYLQQFICLSKQRLVQERRAAAAKKRAHSDRPSPTRGHRCNEASGHKTLTFLANAQRHHQRRQSRVGQLLLRYPHAFNRLNTPSHCCGTYIFDSTHHSQRQIRNHEARQVRDPTRNATRTNNMLKDCLKAARATT